MTSYAGKYITSDDLSNRLNPGTYIAIFDDANTGSSASVNIGAVQLVIDSAEGQVDSYLITEYPDRASSTDRLIRMAALEYACAMSYERHPEYQRTFGENRRSDMWKRADELMSRIRDSEQKPSDLLAETGQQPANVGCLIHSDGPRLMVDTMTGVSNSGDF